MRDIDETVSFHLERILDEIIARSTESSPDKREQVINYYANVNNVIQAITTIIHDKAQDHWGVKAEKE